MLQAFCLFKVLCGINKRRGANMRFTGNIRWLRTRRGGECLKIMNKTLDKKLVKIPW